MAPKRNWIEHDADGHEEVVRRRGVATLPLELLGNAWDTEALNVAIRLSPVQGRSLVEVIVEDDDPTGFEDLTDAYTLYRRSLRRDYPNKRGRFGIGEKEVLVLCTKAEIKSTKGTVTFAEDGTRHRSRAKRHLGTSFTGTMKMTREEYHDALRIISQVLPPDGVNTTLNGHQLGDYGEFLGTFTDTLPTELAREDGSLGRTTRKTEVHVYRVPPGSTPHIYEMGIPVCEIPGDKWHLDVQQKVPLPRDRDSVSPKYLQRLRVAVLNNFHEELDEADSAEAWVSEALESDEIEEEAFEEVFTARYGEKTVIADPSDPEATNRAASEGYTVVHGGAGGKGFWTNAKQFDATKPAGQVVPTSKPEFSIGGEDVQILEQDQTPGMRAVVKYAERIGEALLGFEPVVNVARDRYNRKFRAWYGSRCLTFNLVTCGHKFFNEFPANIDEVNDLLIHEFGHEYCSNHLDEAYYRALTRLGAKMVRLALTKPRIFKPKVKGKLESRTT